MVPQQKRHCAIPSIADQVDPSVSSGASNGLSRQRAFRGPENPDIFFNSKWWLYPRDETASTSGRALEQWMYSVRIVRRSYYPTGRVDHSDVEAMWRAQFGSTFPGFDILQPGEDPSRSTRWPGWNV